MGRSGHYLDSDFYITMISFQSIHEFSFFSIILLPRENTEIAYESLVRVERLKMGRGKEMVKTGDLEQLIETYIRRILIYQKIKVHNECFHLCIKTPVINNLQQRRGCSGFFSEGKGWHYYPHTIDKKNFANGGSGSIQY